VFTESLPLTAVTHTHTHTHTHTPRGAIMNPLPSSTLVPLESLILHDAHRQDQIFCMCVCVCVCVCVCAAAEAIECWSSSSVWQECESESLQL